MSRKKIYYPEGQIQKGLYTQGKEWMLEDGTEYVGDYHTYITGEVFTKSSYVKNISKKLVPYIDLSQSSNKTNFKYDSLLEDTIDSFVFARYQKNVPTQEDYDNGFYYRFFAKRHFNGIIVEVSEDTFNELQPEHYKTLELAWKLRDDAVIVNQRQVRTAEKDIKGISNYITNYSEFVKL
jgi:hypothetical protein